MFKKITLATVVALSMASGVGAALARDNDSRSDHVRSECARTTNPAACQEMKGF